MPLPLRIQPGDELPIYRQITRQVVAAIASGRLAPGEQLPSHRALSESLVVAPLTVKKAYDELERAGYVRTLRGQGTFVTEERRELPSAERIERLREAVRSLLQEAWVGGITGHELRALLDEEERRLEGERSDHERDRLETTP